tara:strand:- start:7854 stop:11375 length:3522 start_codon:yes stop_codon:yes gene_type:complete
MAPTYYSGQHNGDFRDFRANFGHENTLESNQFLTIFDALSEGEIAGPANAVRKALLAARYPSQHPGSWGVGTDNFNREALTDVFLNETPINGATPSFNSVATENVLINNFGEVKNEFKYGTATQTVTSQVGISSTETTVNVQTKVEQASPVTQTISTPFDTDGAGDYPIRITLTWPTLFRQKHDTGTQKGVTVRYKIEHKYTGQADFSNAFGENLQVQGKSKGPYSRDHKLVVSNDVNLYPLQIRVTRITDDGKSDSIDRNGKHWEKDSVQSDMNWSTYTLIKDEPNTYSNTAYHAFKVDAERFGGQPPARMYKIRGLKTKIPAPYTNGSGTTFTPTVDPTTGRIEYPTGYIFQGSFTTATHWNTDPAMLLREILLNERFGLGEFIKENQISNYDFYTVSHYNSDLLSTNTGLEPRFSFNGSLQTQDNAFNVINKICSNMRVTPYWSNNSLRLIQDSPQSTSYLFTLANVVEGGFSYSGTPQDTKFTVVNVSFFNMNTYKKDVEQVEDETTAPQSKYGIVSKNVEAVGCTSRQQANRMGRALLYSQTHENEVCSFTTSIAAGVICRPGQVIEIADPMRQGKRTAGLIKSATTTAITIDSDTDITFSSGSELSVVLSDGTVETKTVSSISLGVITVSSAYTSAPQSNSLWVYKTGTLTTSTWKVISVTEKDDLLYDISCIPYNSGKYDYIEQDIALPERQTSELNVIPQPPTSLSFSENIVEVNDTVVNRITLSWNRPLDKTNQTQFLVRYRNETDNYSRIITSDTTVDIDGLEAGLFECEVYSMAQSAIVSGTFASLNRNIIGKTAAPSAPTNVQFANGLLTWTQSTDLDVKIGGSVCFKWTSRTTGATWQNSTTLIDPIPGASTQVQLPSLGGTVLIAFKDSGYRKSDAVGIVLNDSDINLKTIKTQTEQTGFSGTKTNLEVNSNKLRLTTTDNFDSITDFNNLTIAGTNVETLDEVGSGVYNSGTYTFSNVIDMEGVYPVRFKQTLKTANIVVGTTIEDRGTNIDDWTTFDGDVAYSPDASILVDSTDDDPTSASPTWNGYQKMTNTLLQGRGFRFKAEVTTADSSENIEIEELGFTANLEPSTQQSTAPVGNGGAAKTITFPMQYWPGTSALGFTTDKPSVSVNVISPSSGDIVELAISANQFIATIKNSSGSIITDDFNWIASGHGQAV